MKNSTLLALSSTALIAFIAGCSHDRSSAETPTDADTHDEIQYREAAPSDLYDERVVISEYHRDESRGSAGTTNTVTAKKKAVIKRMNWKNSEVVKRMSDVEALNRLWHLNQSEIAMADLAESKAKSEALVTNARRVKADQQKRADAIKSLAEKRKIKLESFQLATYEVAVKNQLDELKDADFDLGYHAALTRAHREASHDLQLARQEVRDREILGLIRKNTSSLTAKVALPVRSQDAKERASAE